jgi:hypothetical protein
VQMCLGADRRASNPWRKLAFGRRVAHPTTECRPQSALPKRHADQRFTVRNACFGSATALASIPRASGSVELNIAERFRRLAGRGGLRLRVARHRYAGTRRAGLTIAATSFDFGLEADEPAARCAAAIQNCSVRQRNNFGTYPEDRRRAELVGAATALDP